MGLLISIAFFIYGIIYKNIMALIISSLFAISGSISIGFDKMVEKNEKDKKKKNED